MRPLTRVAAWLVAGFFAPVALAGPAHAADEITIDHVETTPGKIQLLVSVDAIPGGAAADPSSLEVLLGGMTLEAKVKAVSAGDIKRSTVLVLDASNSMQRNGKFDSAVAAVTAFLDAAPSDVAIGLVTFAGDVAAGLEPTTDHNAVRTALNQVTLASGTAVYDGIVEGVELLGETGSRSLLVLSDGADVSSSNTLAVATGAAKAAGVVVDVVSLAQAARAQELAGIADETGGAVVPAQQAALSSVFTAQATALAQQLLVTASAPSDAPREASVIVSVEAGGATYSDSAFVTVPEDLTNPTVKAVESGKALVDTPAMLAGALALAIGLAGILAVVLTGATDSRSRAVRQLDAYFEAGTSNGNRRKEKNKASADLKGSAVAIADRVVTEDLESRISQRLTGAGSALTAAEWLLLHAAIAIASAFGGFVFAGGLGLFLGLLLGAVLPWLYLKFRHRRRLNAFNGQLAQTLGLMAGGLQAGLSLPQAVDTVVREGHEPMAGELRRALVEQRLGIEITDALESVGHRMESQDFDWVVMAIRIQREVGGNLAEILHTVADTIREREYLRRQVRALSAEGRLSGYILVGLPVGIFVYLMFVKRDYIEILWTTTAGYLVLGAAVLLISMGAFFMAKLAKVEM